MLLWAFIAYYAFLLFAIFYVFHIDNIHMKLEIIFINILGILEFLLYFILRKKFKYNKKDILLEFILSFPFDLFMLKITFFSLIRIIKIFSIIWNQDKIL